MTSKNFAFILTKIILWEYRGNGKMMTKFELARGGNLVGKVSRYDAKKLNLKKTAFKLTRVTAKGYDGKVHECFVLTNKQGYATPLLKSIGIELEGYLGATTKRCLCETVPTTKDELGYVYVNLQNGDISNTFNIVGRGHDHKNDYAINKDGVIQVVHDNLTMEGTDYTFAGRPTSTDYKSYTRDAGFIVKHTPTGKYGVVSTFGKTDGAIKVLCPPVFDSKAIGHRTISTEKYNFLYEYFTDTEKVLADTCYELALQKVKAGEDFRVGDNIQKWRANHPAVIEAREKAGMKFKQTAERGPVEPATKSVIERIKDRHEEIKSEIAMARAAKAVTDTHYIAPSAHIADAVREAYPMDTPISADEYKMRRHYTPCEYLGEMDDYDMY